MDHHDAVYGRSDSEAATDPPADDAGSDEQLRSTLEHATFLRLPTASAGGPNAYGADFPSSLRAVDGVGPEAATNFPGNVEAVDGTGRRAAAGLPAGGPAILERLHGPL